MSKGYRLYCVAIGGCLVGILPNVALGQEQEEPKKPQTPNGASEKPSPPPGDSAFRSILDEAVKTYTREKAANEEADKRKDARDDAALITQQEAARWAFWSMFIAAVAFLANAITIGLVWLTFRETRRTADAAIRAADASVVSANAAASQAEIAKDSVTAAVRAADAAEESLHTNRAWVFYNTTESTPLRQGTVGGQPFSIGLQIAVVWQNVGLTPARDVKFIGSYRVVPFGSEPQHFDRSEANLGGPEQSTIMGAGQSIKTFPYNWVDKDFHDFFSRRTEIWFYGFLTYRDIYSSKSLTRETEVCMRITCPGEAGLADGRRVPIIEPMPIGPQNTAN